MAYSPSEKYPGAVDSDPNYKGGKFRDNNPSTTNNGSPLKAIDRNELLARDEAIMNDAGFEYSGVADTPQDSQLFKAYKASLGNGANLLSNHNFLIQTPDDSQPLPSSTPTSYPPGYQIFSGVFANETTGITNLTYIDGRVSFSGGDLYFAVPNSGGIERITSDQLTASVADFDGKPRTRGVSFALVGDEYRVTVGVDALEDVSAVLTLLGSVKFEQGSVATRHEAISKRTSFESPSDLSISGASVGLQVFIKSRMNAAFKVVSGGTANGYDILDAGGGNTAELQVNGTYGFIEYFGGIGGDIDETGSILAMVDWCNLNKKIPFTGLQSKCSSPLILEMGLVGIKGQSKITFPEGFINPESSDDRKLFCVWNKNYSKIYDESTADTFKVHGIEFRTDFVTSSIQTNAIIGTANTNGVEIFDNKISSADIAGNTSGGRTCLSFYDANKSLSIHDNDLYNENQINGGGCVWVQGGSGSTLDDPQASENIRIFRNNIYQDRPSDGDEAIALYASGGVLKNVRVYDNTLYLNGGGQGVSAFSTPSPATVGGLIDDIKLYENTIYSDLEFNVARFGGQYLPETITNIEFTDNRIFCKTSNTGSSFVVRVLETGGAVIIKRNYIVNTGTVKFTRGLAGTDFVNKTIASDNTLIGGFDRALSMCYVASDNTIDGADWALDECVKCTDNELLNIKTYMARFSGSENYIFNGNVGNMLPGALIAIYQTAASTGDVTAKINDITTNDANTRSILCQGTGASKQRSQINSFSGTGMQPAFSNSVVSTGNDYYGTIT